MFKHLCYIFIFILLLCSSNGFADSVEGGLQGYAYTKYTKTVDKLNSPWKLATYNLWHFRYMRDKEQFGKDYWQTAFQFFVNKHGDCDDFAIWNFTILQHHNYKVQLLLVRNSYTDSLHLMVKAEKKGKVRFIDSDDYFRSLPDKYTIERTFNSIPKTQIKPLEEPIILKKGEMIKIK